MGPEHVCPSSSVPPPANSVCVVEGYTVLPVKVRVRPQVGVYVEYDWLSIYLRADLSLCVCMHVGRCVVQLLHLDFVSLKQMQQLDNQ